MSNLGKDKKSTIIKDCIIIFIVVDIACLLYGGFNYLEKFSK